MSDDCNDNCAAVHRCANASRRYRFPFGASEIPSNGVYILFEKGECGHGQDRIVRIGSHTGSDRLSSRLEEHFVKENKDRSIFRKNIGKAILNQRGDSFLKYWEKDLTSKENKEKYASQIDFEYQKCIEKQVSQYMRCNFSFCVIGTADKEENPLVLEKKLIATISLCSECRPSKDWLGRYSPEKKIVKSGLWQVHHLYKTEKTLSASDVRKFFSDYRAFTQHT